MMPKLGFSLQAQYDRPMDMVITLLAQAGFAAVSPVYSETLDLSHIANCVQKHDMVIQSLHAPLKVASLWQKDAAVSNNIFHAMLKTVDACAQFLIPIMVVHSWQGLIYTFPSTPLYFDNFDRIVEYALQRMYPSPLKTWKERSIWMLSCHDTRMYLKSDFAGIRGMSTAILTSWIFSNASVIG